MGGCLQVQQRGLGTHLMMEVERLAKEEGCMRVQILTVNLRPKLVGWFSKYHYIISGIKTWSEVVGNNEAVKEVRHCIACYQRLLGPN